MQYTSDVLYSDQVYTTINNEDVKLDRPVPGDGTRWYAYTKCPYTGRWSSDFIQVEPSDLLFYVGCE